MMTDNPDDLSELHSMALRVGLKRIWFQSHPLHPHYDLRPAMRLRAIQLGAIPVTRVELVKLCSRMFQDKGSA